MSGQDDVGLRLDLARGTLATEVRLRGSARAVRDAFPIGSEERKLAQGLLRVANRKVLAAVRAAHTAGVAPAELAATVGVTVQRISQIIRSARIRPGHDEVGPPPRWEAGRCRSTGWGVACPVFAFP
ncbi:hypothetical protein [Embleya sp. NPDC020886]|uniref:hypothetical protein n=1 Tax=Embleya sp. NPDC020886 TaxID=3363980 RepID=UPI0037ADBC01